MKQRPNRDVGVNLGVLSRHMFPGGMKQGMTRYETGYKTRYEIVEGHFFSSTLPKKVSGHYVINPL